MDPKILAALIASCAPDVHPHTMTEIIRVESGNDELAININRLRRKPPPPLSPNAAASIAKHYMAKGYTVDIGLAQINSANLPALGITVEQAFDPCINIKSGATIFADAYKRARADHPGEQKAIDAALSVYNTGSYTKGFLNGYVNRYYSLPPITAEINVPAPSPRPEINTGFAPGVAASGSDAYERQVKEVMLTDPS